MLSKKIHFRGEEVVIQREEPPLRATEPVVLVPAVQLGANPSVSRTQFSVSEGCNDGSKSLGDCQGLSGEWGIEVAETTLACPLLLSSGIGELQRGLSRA